MNRSGKYPNNLIKDIIKLDESKCDMESIISREKIVYEVEIALNNLSKLEKEVIKKYYEDGKTLKEIGKEYGYSNCKIKDDIERSLRKLRLPSNFKYIKYGLNLDYVSHKYEGNHTENKLTKISKLGLSNRAYNKLRRVSIQNLEELLKCVNKCSEFEKNNNNNKMRNLMDLKGIGPKVAEEILYVLKNYYNKSGKN